jgi:hypothetical protein
VVTSFCVWVVRVRVLHPTRPSRLCMPLGILGAFCVDRYPCTLCGKVLEHKIMLKHVNAECSDRIVDCEFGCDVKFKACEKSLHEVKRCTMRPTPCKCGLM